MKTYINHRLLLLCLFFLFGFVPLSFAQSAADSVFSVNDVVFKCERNGGALYVENVQSIELNELQRCKQVSSIDSPSLSLLLTTVFSQERMEELKGKSLLLNFWVDRQQMVQRVRFRFTGTMPITNEELYLLETGLKQKVKISYHTEDDCLYASMYKPVRFDKLLEERK